MRSETVEAVEVALGRFASERPALRRVLLAVSGGPDSLALLLAFADRALPVEVSVATVDHGLRPESAGEAAFVAAVCRDLGLSHRTLVWRKAAAARGNLMELAREARYRLLAREAARVGADAVLTAHHADDQIETHLLARGRGASGAGLAGMRAWRDLEPGLVLLRPFLERPKRALEESVARAGLRPVRDPSNDDPRYRRVHYRRELAAGAHDADGLREALARAGEARAAQDRALADAITQACDEGRLHVEPTGAALFLPAGEGAAIWSRLLTVVGGGARPPERPAAERLVERLTAGEVGTATLSGCRVDRSEAGFEFCREFGRTGPASLAIEDAEALCFDRRFDLAGPFPSGAVRVEPLGRLGLGNRVQRTLPVCLDADSRLLAVHSALRTRLPRCAPIHARQRIGWRIWADLPLAAPDRLTVEPQIAANGLKAVGKDLAATYLRGRVKVRAP